MKKTLLTYSPTSNPVPAPPLHQRLLRIAPWLLRLPFLSQLIQYSFKNVHSCQVSPGFYSVIPEYLFAKNVNLNDTVFINYAPVTIGSGSRFSGENLLLTSTHSSDDFSIVTAKPIVIGSNTWITYRCIILGGVTIGDNVIIGAGSVVANDVPSNVLASGNPCRIIKTI